MKTPYLYFGRKGYHAIAAVVNGVYPALTIANSGMMPIVKADSVLPSATGMRVVHRAADAVAGARGTDYTVDFVTGATMTQAIVADDVTELSSAAAYTVGSGDEVFTIQKETASEATGITATVNDTMYFEEYAFNAAVLPICTAAAGAAGVADLCVPATSFIGAEPLAYSDGAAGDAGLHYDGTALDATRLYFKSGDGYAVDTVDLLHTEAKYKDVCEAMEDMMNSSVYDEMVKVHYLHKNGQFVHNALSSRGISIKRCLITSVARS